MQPNAANGKRENGFSSLSGISNALRQLSVSELTRHKLLGLGFSRGWLVSGASSAGHDRLLENIRREAVVSSVLDDCGRSLEKSGLAVGLLKGTALWQDLYRPGEREVSDIDLYVDGPPDGPGERRLLRLVAELGFARQIRSRGRASRFKTVCAGEKYGDLSVEVHTRLWWREPNEFKWSWRPSLREPFLRLTLEDQLIHLCGHWVAQHTMISMHWLVDIALFLERHHADLDEARLRARAGQLRLSRALGVARDICAGLPRYGVDFEFLREPRRDLYRYFRLKHVLQDSWREALLYDLAWLETKLSGNA